MLARISSRELSEWQAFNELEPFGEFSQEYRAGLIASMVANTARDEKKQPEPFQPVDFMRAGYKGDPEQVEPPEPPSPEALMERIDQAMRILGGKRGNVSKISGAADHRRVGV